MLHMLLICLSWGALLFLLLPTAGTGIIFIALAFFAGCGLMLWRKHYEHFFRGRLQWFALPPSCIFAVTLGLAFYTHWLPSSKVSAISTLLHIPLPIFLTAISCILVSLAACFLFTLLSTLANAVKDASPKKALVAEILLCSLAAILSVILPHQMLELSPLSMGGVHFLWNAALSAALILLFFFLTGKLLFSVGLVGSLVMLLATVSTYVFQFRGRMLEPIDIFSVGTALNVAGNYSLLPVPRYILLC